MLNASSMLNSNQDKLNDTLTIEVENITINKRVKLVESSFNPQGMGTTEFCELWGDKKLQVSFQHLNNGFMNLTVYWSDDLLLMLSAKASNEDGLAFSCSLGAEEKLHVRSSC